MPDPDSVQQRAVVVQNANRLVTRLGPQAKKFHFDREEIIVVVANKMATIIGHGNGNRIGKATPERLAQLLRQERRLVGVEIVFLASCWVGTDWVGKTLHELLGIEVWAPITPVAITEDGILRAFWRGRPTDPREVAQYWHSWS